MKMARALIYNLDPEFYLRGRSGFPYLPWKELGRKKGEDPRSLEEM